jgi:hypothetical protein
MSLIGQYGTMQFGKFEEIQKKGYHAAMDILEKWDEEGKLPSAYIAGKDVSPRGRKRVRVQEETQFNCPSKVWPISGNWFSIVFYIRTWSYIYMNDVNVIASWCY